MAPSTAARPERFPRASVRSNCRAPAMLSAVDEGGHRMTDWNFADVYEAMAARVPDRPCQVQGGRVSTWAQFDARANALAADLLAAGLTRQSKVAAYLYNGPEYLETYV